ncbi:hypothetical protein ACLM5J_19740 [Nocardioides sp. Bht2]|uniref:hypothetical protein n=1 Tax=Nocardioides sp. Bht2 TaxID=3392297 RepID=UPI0039B68706
MTDTTSFDPFAGIQDEVAADDHDTLTSLLDDAKRGYLPLRKSFAQRHSSQGQGRDSPRGSTLAAFVTPGRERALELFLLIHALQPMLDGNPLHLGTWARALSAATGKTVTASGVSRTLGQLEAMNLLERLDTSRSPVLELKSEDGLERAWKKPGQEPEGGAGYFVIPHLYWTLGLSRTLNLPGKAMMLVLLSHTQNPQTPAMAMPLERTKDWYGISERTAERGYRELSQAGLLKTKIQKIPDPRHPAGRVEKYWRALAAPFDTPSRQKMQAAAIKAATQKTLPGMVPPTT